MIQLMINEFNLCQIQCYILLIDKLTGRKGTGTFHPFLNFMAAGC